MTVTPQLLTDGRLAMAAIPHISDRRHDTRFTVHLEVGFAIVDEKTSARMTSYHPAVLVNRSREGCCLLVDRLEFGGVNLMNCLESVKLHYLLIVLRDKYGVEQPYELKGFVRWVHGFGGDQKTGYLIGIELTPAEDEPAEATPRGRVVGHS